MQSQVPVRSSTLHVRLTGRLSTRLMGLLAAAPRIARAKDLRTALRDAAEVTGKVLCAPSIVILLVRAPLFRCCRALKVWEFQHLWNGFKNWFDLC